MQGCPTGAADDVLARRVSPAGTSAVPASATDEVFQLAEGPVWDTPRRRLLWVDILAGCVIEGRLRGSGIEITDRHSFDDMVSAVAVASDGTLLVAGREQLIVQYPDGGRTHGPQIIPPGEPRRCNDGSTDPGGRFVIGTLSLSGDTTTEVLVRVEPSGELTTLDDDLVLSNGLAWSVDGSRMYSVDSLRRVVFVREYDADTGSVGERRVHVQLADGLPDGIAVDADDYLWVAVWGKGAVHRYSPDGVLVESIELPAPNTTSVAFAGEELRTLVVTSASSELSAHERQAFPQSGRVFVLDLDVPGHPAPQWCGRPCPSIL